MATNGQIQLTPGMPGYVAPTTGTSGTSSTPPTSGSYGTVATPNGPQYISYGSSAPITPPASTAPATYMGQDGVTYNSATGQPESESAAPGTVQSESDIYAQNLAQGQTIIDQINAAAQAQIQSANTQIDQTAATNQQNQNALAAITGGFGSSAAGYVFTVSSAIFLIDYFSFFVLFPL